MELNKRYRRLRTNSVVRNMVAETSLTPDNFIVPLFIMEGNNKREAIASMPGYFRLSLDLLKNEIAELKKLGLGSVLLFVKVPDNLKDNEGKEAVNPQGLMQRAVRLIKEIDSTMVVMTDVALDPYSSYGHDGIVSGQEIVNDATVEVLAAMSVSHAQAGADFVAPSDMMDGRVKAIRKKLDEAGFTKTGILSYSAKYASSFYGPFRDALDSAPGFGDKKTYQMDFRNSTEALKETLQDVEEGADIVMVKPAGAYLDIIRRVKDSVQVPVAAYQVSGEYAMIKAAAANGWLDEKQTMIESLTAIRRAGADIIVSYFAKDFAKTIK
ncbi:delta-aminolevulinic acid dehydratase [Cytophagales bacterium WSM2-2]|nr:delta-aminolevulinic acid dehydratase [Cytophagales bacterium WSM2-2]